MDFSSMMKNRWRLKDCILVSYIWTSPSYHEPSTVSGVLITVETLGISWNHDHQPQMFHTHPPIHVCYVWLLHLDNEINPLLSGACHSVKQKWLNPKQRWQTRVPKDCSTIMASTWCWRFCTIILSLNCKLYCDAVLARGFLWQN